MKSVDKPKNWSDEEINKLELGFLHNLMSCKDPYAVDACIYYSIYLSKVVQLNSDNYPVFFRILELENHWVVDALVGDRNPEKFFKEIQPNSYMIQQCFEMLTNWQCGGIYSKNLLIIFGILKVCFENQFEGFRMYPLTITDVNNLGKHLDKSKDQMDAVNGTILYLLDKIASLIEPGVTPRAPGMAEISNQANNIRGKFLDMTKKLNEAIPDILLIKGDYTVNEIAPNSAIK